MLMDKKVIFRLEELVEKISGYYSAIPTEIVKELNDLTGNGWTEKEYIEYCAEYWSRSTLEETVYALLHRGEYPCNVETQLFFWKSGRNVDLSDKEIVFQLRDLPETADGNIICNFGDLPVRECYNWLCSFFPDWEKDKEITEEEMQSGTFKVIFDDDNFEEYAKFRYVVLKVYGSKMISLDCCNLYEKEKEAILSFAKRYGLYIFEKR